VTGWRPGGGSVAVAPAPSIRRDPAGPGGGSVLVAPALSIRRDPAGPGGGSVLVAPVLRRPRSCGVPCLMRDLVRTLAPNRVRSMASLTLSAIPSSINTYERLAVWAIQCLQSIANGQEVNVVDGAGSVPIAQCQISVTADNVDRFILTAYVPVTSSALNSATAKTWMAANDIAAAAPHTNLLSN